MTDLITPSCHMHSCLAVLCCLACNLPSLCYAEPLLTSDQPLPECISWQSLVLWHPLHATRLHSSAMTAWHAIRHYCTAVQPGGMPSASTAPCTYVRKADSAGYREPGVAEGRPSTVRGAPPLGLSALWLQRGSWLLPYWLASILMSGMLLACCLGSTTSRPYLCCLLSMFTASVLQLSRCL